MYCIAEQVVLPPLKEKERKRLLEKAALMSVYEILDAVPDPRKRHGLRYELAFLLTCLLAALLCNCNSTGAVAQWCREHAGLLREVFGARLFVTPSGSLYRKLLPRLDVQAVENVLGRWIQATLPVAGRVVTSDALHTHADAHADHSRAARHQCLHRQAKPTDLVCSPRYLFCRSACRLPAS